MTSIAENFLSNFDAVLSGAAVLLVVLYFAVFRRSTQFPPGPKGLPFVGYPPFLGENAAETLMKLKPKYGPIMTVQMGMDYWVVLNDYRTIHEALVKQATKFSGRSPAYMFLQITEGGWGMINRDYGSAWKDLSRFVLMTIRDAGVGRKRMEQKVQGEMSHFVESWLDSETGSVKEMLSLAISNLISWVCFGSRFEYDDEKFLKMTRILREFQSTGTEAALLGLIQMVPILRHFPPFRGAYSKHINSRDQLLGIFQEIIEEHKKTFDENDIRDFVDAFLKEMRQRGEDDSVFVDKQLLHLIRDLFDAGAGSTSSVLTWSVLCFLNHPDCQQKVFEEVERVIGESAIPSMKHRDAMPYTCAFIHELLRHRTLVPLAVTHKTNAVAYLGGYKIPENTIISPNLWAVHMDPVIFEDPEVFRPERFLDKEGKFVESKHVVAFSLGPRRCVGEQLAKVAIFVFLAGIVQRVEILPDLNKPPPLFETKDLGNGFTFEPPEFSLKLRRR